MAERSDNGHHPKHLCELLGASLEKIHGLNGQNDESMVYSGLQQQGPSLIAPLKGMSAN